MAAAASMYSGRTHSQLTRTVEKVLEEAHLTGELNLSGRKCKEFPKIATKYDLEDTIIADLSKNRLCEVPPEVCDYISLEVLDCYHNAIRCIPDLIVKLQCLSHLNLSRNQMTTIPPSVCQLSQLQVLIVCHNKLVSLPEEIGQLHKLMQLDVSSNEISHLPPQIGNVTSLRSLNLRRNLLVELPLEITMLRLIELDASCNRIVFLPTRLRFMDSLAELHLENNPLSSPPAYLCTRGRVHVFKFLDIQALKEDRKKGILGLESDYRRSQRRPPQCFESRLNGSASDDRLKRYTIDSGYSTSDGDKTWFRDPQEMYIEPEDGRRQALKSAELAHDKRKRNSHLGLEGSVSIASTLASQPSAPVAQYSSPLSVVCGTPLALSRTQYNSMGRPVSEELVNGKTESQSADEHQKASVRLLEDHHDESTKMDTSGSPVRGVLPENNVIVRDGFSPGSTAVPPIVVDGKSPYGHVQTYREYKEALQIKRNYDSNNVYRRPQPETQTVGISESEVFNISPGSSSLNHTITADDYHVRQQDQLQKQQQFEIQMSQLRLDEEKRKQKFIQKEAVLSYVKSRTSPLRSASSESDRCSVNDDYSPKSSTPSPSPCPLPISPSSPTRIFTVQGPVSPSDHSRGSAIHSPILHNPPVNGTVHKRSRTSLQQPSEQTRPSYTMHRFSEKIREEKEQIESLRRAIEARLKVSLPENLSSALTDGVVLCHLANHVQPRSVASIHVPSPAVPKLTVAKCRRNVENFLEACRRIGVPKDAFCSTHDILEEKNLLKVATTVHSLLKFHSRGNGKQSSI